MWFDDLEGGLRETERLTNLKKSVKMSGHYLLIINWSLNNISYKILWLLSLAQSALKAKKSWNLWNSGCWFFELWEYVGFDRASIHDGTPDLLTLSTTLFDVSVLSNLFSNAQMRQFSASGNQRVSVPGNRPVNDVFLSWPNVCVAEAPCNSLYKYRIDRN